jgi:type VI secretion system lysozyme-like protein
MALNQRPRGTRPLLFERLIGSARSASGIETDLANSEPSRMHNAEALRASVGRELMDLLNTRAPLPIDQLEGRTRTAIDYGIPDLSAFPIGEISAMARLTRHVRDAIAAYEPRLRNPVVTIDPMTRSGAALTVTVSGELESGTIRNMPVTFALVPGVVQEAIEVEADDR